MNEQQKKELWKLVEEYGRDIASQVLFNEEGYGSGDSQEERDKDYKDQEKYHEEEIQKSIDKINKFLLSL